MLMDVCPFANHLILGNQLVCYPSSIPTTTVHIIVSILYLTIFAHLLFT